MNLLKFLRNIEIKHGTREALHVYSFVMIWIIGFGIFTLAPLAETFFYSLNQVTVTATGITLDPVAALKRARIRNRTFCSGGSANVYLGRRGDRERAPSECVDILAPRAICFCI